MAKILCYIMGIANDHHYVYSVLDCYGAIDRVSTAVLGCLFIFDKKSKSMI